MAQPTEISQDKMEQRIKNPSCFLLKRWFSLSDAAIYTGFSEVKLRKATYSGELQIGQKGTRGKIYFDVMELDSWMLKDFGEYSGPVDTRKRDKGGKFVKGQ
jgi:hypothetical protein